MFGYQEGQPDPESPGWTLWHPREDGRFNATLGPLRLRLDGDKAVIRFVPTRAHTNRHDQVHGGALMGFVDTAIFAAALHLGCERIERSVTVDCTFQFLGAAAPGIPIDAIIEVTRETGRMVFLRGLLEQSGVSTSSFTALIRKASA